MKFARLCSVSLSRYYFNNTVLVSHSLRKGFHSYTSEPFHPIPGREPEIVSADRAVGIIKSGYRVYVHSHCCTPLDLLEALADHGKQAKLRDVELIHLLLEGDAKWTKPEYSGIFRSNNLFVGTNCREAVNSGLADYVPIFLSDVPQLFLQKILPIDVALVSVAPPDKHGYCTLGGAVDCSRAAVKSASYVVGLVNSNMPRTFGDGIIHKSHFDALVLTDRPLPEKPVGIPTSVEKKIGEIIASELVDDGATLQLGIGNIPNIVQTCLGGHKHLGVHTEMFSDPLVDLVEKGVVTNAKKMVHQGKVVGGFCIGTKRLYDFINNNPFIVMCDIAFINNAATISQNPKVTAINSCIEVDLTGQVVADSVGDRIISGVGGQLDFLRGAALSHDGLGKPIIATTSTNKKGDSKIVPYIKEGAGVVTTRSHVHYIVTEYGIAYLFGKNIRQRAYHLINIAHPDHRETLEKAAFKRFKCMPSP